MGKEVGGAVKALREQEGLSQSAVARALGLKTAQSISNIERGVSPLPIAAIKKLSKTIGGQPEAWVDLILLEKKQKYMRSIARAR